MMASPPEYKEEAITPAKISQLVLGNHIMMLYVQKRLFKILTAKMSREELEAELMKIKTIVDMIVEDNQKLLDILTTLMAEEGL